MRMIKVILSLLLFFAISIASIDYLNAKSKSSKDIAEEYKSTLMHHTNDTSFSYSRPKTTNYASLESKYDSRDYGYVTSVKDQGLYNTCWAFSACSVAETSLIKKGLASKDDIDLSESHLAYYFYNTYEDPYHNTHGDKTIPLYEYYMNGANNILTVYVLNNFGLANESDYPYETIESICNSASQKAQYDTNYILKNAYMIDPTDTYSIKQMIKENGSVILGYSSYSKCYYDKYDENNNRVNCSFYNPTDYNDGGHAVTIVGWDDNYSRENFCDSIKDIDERNLPTHDGAWLIKNSWGKAFGVDGYFWMSYEEPSINEITVYDFAAKDSEDIYQYDGSASLVSIDLEDEIVAANVFQVQSNDKLKSQKLDSVSFSVASSSLDYTIDIYSNLIDENDPTSGVLLTTQKGSTTYAGVYTIPLDDDVYLGNSANYSIVITLSSASEEILLSVDYTYDVDWISFVNNVDNEYSYVYLDDEWSKLDDIGCTARIKGYASLDTSSKKNIATLTFEDIEKQNYTGEEICPNVVVYDNSKPLIENIDYKLSYVDNIDAGTSYIFIVGIGDYSGVQRLEFEIVKESYEPTIEGYVGTYDGLSHSITIENVKPDSKVLYRTSTNDEWNKEVPSRVDVGTTTVYYQITNSYYQTIEGSVNIVINPCDIASLIYTKIENQQYTGKDIKPNIVVTNGTNVLVEGKDYMITYKNNLNAGVATIEIKGIGNYTGTHILTFNILSSNINISIEDPLKPDDANRLPNINQVDSGDSTQIGIWITLLGCSSVCILLYVMKTRKNK